MTSRNIDMTALDETEVHNLAQLPAGVLADLQEEVNNKLAEVRRRRIVLDLVLDYKYNAEAQRLRHNQGKDTGIVRFHDGEYTVTAESKKAVIWDQNGLANLAAEIKEAGQDPGVYIHTEIKHTVRENSYKEWPEEIKQAFNQYRTVRPGKSEYLIMQTPATATQKVA